jgi:2-dehydro-3-deoxygalactonokinase
MEPAENYNFLSGLLIGAELKELQSNNPGTIVLVSGAHLLTHYRHALQVLGLGSNLVVKDADEALLRGQWHLYKGTTSPAQ